MLTASKHWKIKGKLGVFVNKLCLAIVLIATLSGPQGAAAVRAQETAGGPEQPPLSGNSVPALFSEQSQTDLLAEDFAFEVYLPLLQGGLPGAGPSANGDWPTLAGNPQRTNRATQEVSGRLTPLWYRSIEAYIPQNVQIIASLGLLFISSARGMYALDADTGQVAWRYDTELPIGNSPTVANGVLYFGGYDRKIHALDAVSGRRLWSFDGAEAGFATNPLVVNNMVYAGNRDGYMYAIGAHGSANQGRLVWKYQTNGQINYSAAYSDNAVYFASDDNRAYAVNAATGALLWKSELLPGDGFHSFWPVVYRDKVIFTAASRYRGQRSGNPGDDRGDATITYEDLFPSGQNGATVGPNVPGQSWASNNPTMDASRLLEYLENHQGDTAPQDEHLHKPWRRIYLVLNRSNGSEFTFDTDGDGWRETAPFVAYGKDGNYYPPTVGSDGLLYGFNIYQAIQGYQGHVMGWNIDQPRYMSVLDTWDVGAEPMVLSAGGDLIYRVTCCDRKATWESINNRTNDGQLFSYNIDQIISAYEDMWQVAPDAISRHKGWYKGNTNSINGIYHYHGNDQNALIPYDDKLFVRRSNTIMAFGRGTARGKQALLTVNPVTDSVSLPSNTQLAQRLDAYVLKTISAGFLRPAYITADVGNYNELENYFQNPGETVLALSLAYPYLTAGTQSQVRTYLQQYYQTYFVQARYAATGWANLAAREAMPLPPEMQSLIPNLGPRLMANQYTWAYPPQNIYSLYAYAQTVPGVDILQVYNTAKEILKVPANIPNEALLFDRYPYEHNAWIASYAGFLKLQDLARTTSGNPSLDSSLRTQVTAERDRMLQLRYTTFDKDTPWVNEDYNYYKKMLDIARNFMYLNPDVGLYYRQNILSRVQTALNEYNYVAPYWLANNFENAPGERGRQHLYNQPAMFQAYAYIVGAPKTTLIKYLDAPKFERGDLFYIQNLAALLAAP